MRPVILRKENIKYIEDYTLRMFLGLTKKIKKKVERGRETIYFTL